MVFGVLPAPNPPRLVAFPTPRAFFAFGFWGFTRPKSLQVGCLPNPRAFFAFGFWGFTRPKSPQVGCLTNPPPRYLCFRFLGFYPPQISPGWLPSQPLRAFFAFGFWGFTSPKSPQVGCLPNPPPPALSLLSVFGVLPAPNPPRLVASPTPRAFFAFGFWGFTRPKSPQVGCLPNPPPRAFFAFGFWGFTRPKSPPPRLVASPTPRAFFAFGFWGFTRPKFPQVGCLPNSPPSFLCFPFLGFYPPQIPPGWLPSQPPVLSLLSVLGFYPPQIPPGWLPYQPPRAFFAFGFWGFTRLKSPQVGCLTNPPRFLCFRFLGFYPPQISPGWLSSQPPALSLLSVFGVLPVPNPPRLVASPNLRAFFAFGFWGFTRPKSPQVGCLPNPPPALSLLSVFGVFPAPNPPRLVAFPTPRAFFAFGFWGFYPPQTLQVGCPPNPTLFLCFPVLGFYPPQTPRSIFFHTTHAIFDFRLLSSLNTISTFLHFPYRCGPIGKSSYRQIASIQQQSYR